MSFAITHSFHYFVQVKFFKISVYMLKTKYVRKTLMPAYNRTSDFWK